MPSIDQMTRDRIRKMARRGRLIDECFKVFTASAYPNASPDQLREMRICFFAGAAELFAVMTAGLDDGISETDGDLIFMQQWVDELEAFHRKTVAAMTTAPSKPS
ncbi:hypothetical protein [Oceanicola sp. S124]|uniref:hypothetical protein n=1 Tax=Oceanicola sp. S124 TaxID=1042378 RepID=UPI0002559C7F|nr:hypothetical protein [Oceanicola sp. S124]